MTRIRNLLLVAIGALALIIVGWTFRAQLAPWLGVNVDGGSGGIAELRLPEGYAGTVFAEGLADPRFMAVSPEGVLFVAERGADRVVALPDGDGDGVADETVEVGSRYGRGQDLTFTQDGTLLVAGEDTLWAVTLEGLREAERRPVVANLPVGGSHSTKSVAVLPDGRMLLSIGSSCNVCYEEDGRRASVQVVEDDELRPWMVGLRNAVGVWVDPATGRAWATKHGPRLPWRRSSAGDDLRAGGRRRCRLATLPCWQSAGPGVRDRVRRVCGARQARSFLRGAHGPAGPSGVE